MHRLWATTITSSWATLYPSIRLYMHRLYRLWAQTTITSTEATSIQEQIFGTQIGVLTSE